MKYVKTFNCSGCTDCAKCNNSYSNAYGSDGLSFEGTPSTTYGPDGIINFHGQTYNAGGYGFWCNKKCAARRDAKLANKQASATAESEQSSSLIDAVKQITTSSSSDDGGNSTLMYVGIGAGVLLIGGILFFILRKK